MTDPLSSLRFSLLGHTLAGLVRAANWHGHLTHLGVRLPTFLIYDVGTLLSQEKFQLPDAQEYEGSPMDAYCGLLWEIAQSPKMVQLRAMGLSDPLVAAVLAHVFGELGDGWEYEESGLLPTDPASYIGVERVASTALKGQLGQEERDVLRKLGESSLFLLTQFELLNVETLRVLGLLRTNAAQALSSMELVDVMATLDSPQAHDIASFSLELLPSILETKESGGTQSFSMDGYNGLANMGSIDSLLLTELAHDEDVFAYKFLNQELLFFSRDRRSDEHPILHYVLIDASASMEGERSVFARGLAAALAKKVTLLGQESCIRFFDGALHEPLLLQRNSRIPVPYLFSFRSNRGRNYTKVFSQLVTELQKYQVQGRQVQLYIVTHGQCHISKASLEKLVGLASLHGVIVLPNSEELPQWTGECQKLDVIDHSSLRSSTKRRDRALNIVDQAVGASL